MRILEQDKNKIKTMWRDHLSRQVPISEWVADPPLSMLTGPMQVR